MYWTQSIVDGQCRCPGGSVASDRNLLVLGIAVTFGSVVVALLARRSAARKRGHARSTLDETGASEDRRG